MEPHTRHRDHKGILYHHFTDKEANTQVIFKRPVQKSEPAGTTQGAGAGGDKGDPAVFRLGAAAAAEGRLECIPVPSWGKSPSEPAGYVSHLKMLG